MNLNIIASSDGSYTLEEERGMMSLAGRIHIGVYRIYQDSKITEMQHRQTG